jgi:1,2-dihydroxy-3-keto-5-methylthiopentene dioxygenase
MSRLRIFAENDTTTPQSSTSDQAEMARELAKIGVTFEQWQANASVARAMRPRRSWTPTAPTSTDSSPTTASRPSTWSASRRTTAARCDARQVPRRALPQGRRVRFFVAGSGLFTLHVEDKVYEVKCEQAT